jgi:hypothetical protein
MFKHSPETDAIIRDGYAKDLPVNWIAKKLRVTKNVVIGRARRLGLSDPQRVAYANSSAKTEVIARWDRK